MHPFCTLETPGHPFPECIIEPQNNGVGPENQDEQDEVEDEHEEGRVEEDQMDDHEPQLQQSQVEGDERQLQQDRVEDRSDAEIISDEDKSEEGEADRENPSLPRLWVHVVLESQDEALFAHERALRIYPCCIGREPLN